MMLRNFWKYLTRVHKWAGLVLGLQILIWFVSGFFMSFFDIENVRGEHIAKRPEPQAVSTDFAALSEAYGGDITKTELKVIRGRAVYVINGATGEKVYDPKSATILTAPDKAIIEEAAKAYYIGEAKIKSAKRLTEAPIEYRADFPVWQVEFDDSSKTRLYLNADTAELTSVRTRLWRVFDFMWMLHIMDYRGRDDINNWWLWLASLMASLFALSGMGLVAHRVFLRPRPWRDRRRDNIDGA